MLRIVDSSAAIPNGSKLVLYTEDELRSAQRGPSAWNAAQLGSVFRESDEDWGSSLDSLVGKS